MIAATWGCDRLRLKASQRVYPFQARALIRGYRSIPPIAMTTWTASLVGQVKRSFDLSRMGGGMLDRCS